MRKIAVLLVLLCAAVHPASAQVNGVTVELELGQEQYLPDEDLQLKVRIANRSGQPIVLGTDNQWITFDAAGEREHVIVRKLGEMPVKGPFTVLSGQVVTREFNPTPYFDFRRPGHYRMAANFRIAQWKQEMACKAVAFTVTEGVPLPDLGDLTVGLPPAPGLSNAPPEVRRYSLLKVSDLAELQLYFRLTDKDGKTLRVFPLARMLSFSDPKAQIDRANNLHVLSQTGARVFTYFVLDVNGHLLARQFHEYTQRRPSLQISDDGGVFVSGGQRLVTSNDIPAPATAPSQSP